MPTLHLNTPDDAAQWLRECGVRSLVIHHHHAAPGCAWLGWPGRQYDLRDHVGDVLRAGASACLLEAADLADTTEAIASQSGRVAVFSGLKTHAGSIASAFYGHPSHQLHLVAVTGTNGKTSTAWWLAQSLARMARPCGLAGTLGQWVPEPGASITPPSSGLTTPDAVALQSQWRQWLDQGVRHVAMEASSIGLAEHRLQGTHVSMALFTNLTRDHLDYHGTLQAYWAAKRQLFEEPLGAAGVNIDDAHGAALAAELGTRPLDLWTVSVQPRAQPARLQARHLQPWQMGTRFEVQEGAQTLPVFAPVMGDFNVNNLLLVVAALRVLGIPLAEALSCVSALPAVPGRLQPVPSGPSAVGRSAPAVYVDYAHTPDALDKVLRVLRPVARARRGQLWCVVGCGGNRDRGKRPLMASIAATQADRVMLTSDNPRHEDPAVILDDMVSGLGEADMVRCQRVQDRAHAITRVVVQAGPNDVVLIAGKGHERTQDMAGVKHPFSDVDVAAKALGARASKTLILGLGDSGWAAARWLTRLGTPVKVWDSRAQPPHAQQLQQELPHVELFSGPLGSAALEGVDQIVKTPGWPPHREPVASLLDLAQQRGIPVRAEWDLFAQAQSDSPSPQVLCITGTNGKTTTTAWTAHLLREAGVSAQAAGNIGPSLLEALMQALDSHQLPQVWVLELSSFQLQDAECAHPCMAAAVTHITPDHLDWHGDLETYAQAKRKVLTHANTAVLNADDVTSCSWGGECPHLVRVSAGPPGRADDWGLIEHEGQTWLARGTQALFPTRDLPLRGRHNAVNALMALALASASGRVPDVQALLPGLRSYVAEPHRLQLCGRWRGVEAFDDSKGTNVGATVAALGGLGAERLPGRLVLILGGDGKGQRFEDLIGPIGQYTRAVALIGRDAPHLEAMLQGAPEIQASGLPVRIHATLEDAVAWGFTQARQGDALLLSPACASWDMFKDYRHRGQVFAAAVATWCEEHPA